jgi:hemoglobin-like flavoprotein
MTPEEINAVKTSFAKVVPIADRAGLMFYEKLFDLDPSLRKMFADDIEPQSKKLMQIISVAVNGLDKLETIVPAVQALGARHVGYGVREEHYDTVATALLWTLEKGLGPDFTPSVKDAWIKTYVLLSDAMKSAAKGVAS